MGHSLIELGIMKWRDPQKRHPPCDRGHPTGPFYVKMKILLIASHYSRAFLKFHQRFSPKLCIRSKIWGLLMFFNFFFGFWSMFSAHNSNVQSPLTIRDHLGQQQMVPYCERVPYSSSFYIFALSACILQAKCIWCVIATQALLDVLLTCKIVSNFGLFVGCLVFLPHNHLKPLQNI